MSASRLRVAAVIPTLNEEAAIAGVIAAIPAGAVDDLIVADSGSTDRTLDRARAAGARIVSETRRGYGRACRAGAEAARDCDIVVFLDGDGADCPELIPLLVEPIAAGRADFVLGSRSRGIRERGSMSAHQLPRIPQSPTREAVEFSLYPLSWPGCHSLSGFMSITAATALRTAKPESQLISFVAKSAR